MVDAGISAVASYLPNPWGSSEKKMDKTKAVTPKKQTEKTKAKPKAVTPEPEKKKKKSYMPSLW